MEIDKKLTSTPRKRTRYYGPEYESHCSDLDDDELNCDDGDYSGTDELFEYLQERIQNLEERIGTLEKRINVISWGVEDEQKHMENRLREYFKCWIKEFIKECKH